MLKSLSAPAVYSLFVVIRSVAASTGAGARDARAAQYTGAIPFAVARRKLDRNVQIGLMVFIGE